MNLLEVRYDMFTSYLDELQTISENPIISDEKKQYLYDNITNYEFSWRVDVYDGDVVIGFFIIGTGENCHAAADYYIQESYIKPEYRRKGHMTRAISDFINRHVGVYCLFILNNNQIGRVFWHVLFDRIGYVPYELADVGAADDDCTQYGFALREKD